MKKYSYIYMCITTGFLLLRCSVLLQSAIEQLQYQCYYVNLAR